MDPETQRLLRENLEISKENNHMLHTILRYQKWSQIYRVFYWGVIIFSSVGAYYFIQPYLSSLVDMYSNGQESITKISEFGKSFGGDDRKHIQDFIDVLKN